MIDLERRLAERYPRWFQGRRARLARPLLRGLGRIARLGEIEAFLDEHAHLKGRAFIEAALAYLDVRYSVDQVERERVPETGRLLVVANHPSGALDALALLHFLLGVRRDVRILANDLLDAVEPLRGQLLPLRILGGRPTPESLDAVRAALEREECVVVFPAGAVSRLGLRGLRDGRWRRGFVNFARATGAPVLPVRVLARNSALFYGAAALCPPAGTALLPRELFARRRARIELRVGRPQRVPEQLPAERALVAVREALYAIGTRREAGAHEPEPLIHAVDRRALLRELAELPLLGQTPDGKRIHAGPLASDSALLRELGRLRELSFRAVGEGTGKRLDVDAWDSWYEHIVLWDPERLEVAGAYRVALGERVLAERGLDGFYTASLFRYPCELLPRLAQGMELGRSFVAPAYQGGRSLDYLWLGIGAYLRRHPEIRYLFGPVSISAALPIAAREQLVAYYQRYHGVPESPVRALRPFRFLATPPAFGELDAEAAFRLLKDNLGALGARVPTLYKQYTELCEPGGARFLAFGVDPEFSNSVDGLVELDLARIRPRKRERYLTGAAVPTLARPEAA
ncbi:GNAT family N-acyltransferase [Arenimonas fontis]|uniref:L-ornithine N(alpha)-acyltransferase n=1 Tax=Arenimonas fontis TaxID=2608255 RepID=A0A5B2ZDH8_9GAMM|nr:GNAT family N-acyltransferase [Arenimonas fontis]KAA2285270.1 GNAT family N-acetyltransferase [Arenimonas fontis]